MSNPSPHNGQVPHQQPTTPRERELMFAILLQNPGAFLSVGSDITPKQAATHNPGMGFAWEVAQEWYEEHGELPGPETIATGVSTKAEDSMIEMLDEETERFDEFLGWAFDRSQLEDPTTQAMGDHALGLARRFLIECAARFAREQFGSGTTPNLANLPDALEETLDQATRAQALSPGADDDDNLFEAGWLQNQESAGTYTTGIGFLNEHLAGGHAANELYMLLAPYGTCKTTLSTMLAVEGARAAAKEAAANADDPDYSPIVVFLVNYETGRDEIQRRIMSYAAEIHIAELFRDNPELSTSPHDLKPYEYTKFAKEIAQGKSVTPEAEREAEARPWLRDHLVSIDFSDKSRSTRGGGGLVAELSQRIERVLRRRNARCGVVVVDHMDAMVDKYIAEKSIPQSEKRIWLDATPKRLRAQVAGRFGCPVWVMHQLSGQANELPEGVPARDTDGAECKTVAKNCDFTFTVSKLVTRRTPHGETDRLGTLAGHKTRRNVPLPHKVIRVNGAFSRVEDVHEKYVFDPKRREITTATGESLDAETPDGVFPSEATEAPAAPVDAPSADIVGPVPDNI